MGKSEKREQRVRDNTANVRLHEFEMLVLRYGEIIEGAHHPKACIGRHIFPYKRENPVKAHYVEAVLGFIDEVKEVQKNG